MIDQSLLAGRPIVVLDLETDQLIPADRDLSTLRLSIGAAWNYRTMQLAWFDAVTLEDLVLPWLHHPVLLVTYNGLGFDLPILTQHLQGQPHLARYLPAWQRLCDQSCDLLARFWAAEPEARFTRGIYRFDQICMVNGLGMKRAPQGDMPHLWNTGQHAKVLNHCQEDVLLLCQLFALGYHTQGRYQRYGSPVTIAMPDLDAWPPLGSAAASQELSV